MTNFIINEAKQMLRFQKTVILLILKAIAYTLRTAERMSRKIRKT